VRAGDRNRTTHHTQHRIPARRRIARGIAGQGRNQIDGGRPLRAHFHITQLPLDATVQIKGGSVARRQRPATQVGPPTATQKQARAAAEPGVARRQLAIAIHPGRPLAQHLTVSQTGLGGVLDRQARGMQATHGTAHNIRPGPADQLHALLPFDRAVGQDQRRIRAGDTQGQRPTAPVAGTRTVPVADGRAARGQRAGPHHHRAARLITAIQAEVAAGSDRGLLQRQRNAGLVQQYAHPSRAGGFHRHLARDPGPGMQGRGLVRNLDADLALAGLLDRGAGPMLRTGQRRPDHRAAQRHGKHRPRCACDHSDRLAAPGNRQGKQR